MTWYVSAPPGARMKSTSDSAASVSSVTREMAEAGRLCDAAMAVSRAAASGEVEEEEEAGLPV